MTFVDALEEIMARRLQRLREIKNREYDGKISSLADQLGVTANYLSRMFSRGNNVKRFGEKLARKFEEKLGKPVLSLDMPASTAVAPPSPDSTTGRWPLKVDPGRIRRLNAEQRRLVEGAIEGLLVTFEKRHSTARDKRRA